MGAGLFYRIPRLSDLPKTDVLICFSHLGLARRFQIDWACKVLSSEQVREYRAGGQKIVPK